MRRWIVSVVALLAFLFGSYWFIKDLLPLVAPFAVALVIAELIGPVVDRLERWRVPRSLGVLLVMVVMFAVVGIGLTLAIAKLASELQLLAANWPYYYPLALDFFQHMLDKLGRLSSSLPASLQGTVQQSVQAVTDSLRDNVKSLTGFLTFFSGVPALITNLLVSVVATFFFARDKRMIGRFLLRLMPETWRSGLMQVRSEVWRSAMGFAKAQLMLILLTMVLSTAGLALIGSKYAVLVGMLIGLCDILPVIGPSAVFAPWIIYHLTVGTSSFGVKLLILYVVTGAIRQMLESKVVGEKIGLHPLATLFSVYIGFTFFGALGFVVGPLLAILLKAMINSGLLPIFPKES